MTNYCLEKVRPSSAAKMTMLSVLCCNNVFFSFGKCAFLVKVKAKPCWWSLLTKCQRWENVWFFNRFFYLFNVVLHLAIIAPAFRKGKNETIMAKSWHQQTLILKLEYRNCKCLTVHFWYRYLSTCLAFFYFFVKWITRSVTTRKRPVIMCRNHFW